MYQSVSDNDLIKSALNHWANHIETGNIVLSMEDAINMGNPKLIKPLNDNQKELVSRIRKLASKH